MDIPRYHIGEIVLWDNPVNEKYIKIVSVFKIITECNNIFYRYAGLKQISNYKYENIEYYITNSIFDETELKPSNRSDLSHIAFELYTIYMTRNVKLLSSNNKYSINFQNMIDSGINIKQAYESVWSTRTLHIRKDKTDISTHTCFLSLKNNDWDKYRDINTNELVYVNHTAKLVSTKQVDVYHNDMMEHPAFMNKPDNIAILRKLILLLYTKNCDHIIDIIKDCVIPVIHFSYMDTVFNNDYEKNFSNVMCLKNNITEIRERRRLAKRFRMLIKNTYLLKDANGLWKVRYLVQTASDIDVKCGYCDQETLSKSNEKKVVHLFDNKPINDLWEDGYYQSQMAKKEYCLYKHNTVDKTPICKEYMETELFLNNQLVLNRTFGSLMLINKSTALFNSTIYIPYGEVCNAEHDFNLSHFKKKRKIMEVIETEKTEYYKFYNFSRNIVKKEMMFPRIVKKVVNI